MCKTITEIIHQCKEIPHFPAAALELMNNINKESISSKAIADILSKDQALSSRVIKLANSPYYGMEKKVSSISDAVIILGKKTIHNLAMIASTENFLSIPLSGYRLSAHKLWAHSFGVAVGSKLIANISNTMDADTAFTAGLLHDIGKVAMNIVISNKIDKVFRYVKKHSVPFDIAEKRVLGFDHTEVGQKMAERWNLPPSIVEAIRFHHTPSEAPENNPYVDCVHIGIYLTMTMGFGLGADGLYYNFEDSAFDRLKIKPSDIDNILDQFVEHYEAYEQVLKGFIESK